ncbi:MAG: 2Fe-2S iron-sulfur cluster-binding protein [Oligoflexales bacterium]
MTDVEVTVSGSVVRVPRGRSLLDCAHESGIDIPSSCRNGVCQSCLMKVVEGSPPAAAQKGLKQAQQQLGLFHACLCYPEQPFECTVAEDAAFKTTAKVMLLQPLSQDVLQVRLSVPPEFKFRGGQFVNLVRTDGLLRSYSIASLPNDGAHIDVHVRRLPDGKMSSWVHDHLSTNDSLEIRGAFGECFYAPESSEQPLLLVGTGTGIAPLYAILRDALQEDHTGPIYFFQGGRNRDGLYLVDELTSLTEQHPNLHYTQCLLEDDSTARVRLGDLKDLVLSDILLYKKARAYLCGAPEMVHLLRKRLFLGGLSMKNISGDAFITSASHKAL